MWFDRSQEHQMNLSIYFQINHILYSNRSAAYIKLEQYEKALADALKAKELDPSWPKVGLELLYLELLCNDSRIWHI